jgi:hypothetical protein
MERVRRKHKFEYQGHDPVETWFRRSNQPRKPRPDKLRTLLQHKLTIDRLRPTDAACDCDLQEMLITSIDQQTIAIGFVTDGGMNNITIPRAAVERLGQALIEAADEGFVGAQV